MATVSYELTFTEHVDTVSRIRFSNKILQGSSLIQDYDPVNKKYRNSDVTGVISNGLTISIAVDAFGATGGEISLKVEVDGKKTFRYPIKRTDKNGVYSFSSEYKLKS
jgi:hypothetical protein